jgi:branched-chain amino acid transport system substrate-binding protein
MPRDEKSPEHDQTDERTDNEVSRREFLKIAGIAGAVVGVGGGLGGVLAACGGTTATTNATTATTVGATSSTAAGSTSSSEAATTATSAAATAEKGREIKVGYVTPITGPIAAFGICDKFAIDRWKEAIGEGLVLGDGKQHLITINMLDSQSDSNRASQVAGDLINNNKVDIVMAAASPDTVNPVADQAEAQATPCITCDCPMEPYFFGRGKKAPTESFKWTYHAFWGLQQIQAVSLDLWSQYPTNKVVGALWPNNTDGNAYRDSYPPVMEKAGYKLIDGGKYPEPNEDFTSMIGSFKSGGAEIFTGLMIPPDFVNFWKQATQQGWKPKVFDLAKAILFPSAMEAVGEIGYGLSGPMFWHPSYPFKSSLTGETCQQIADEWEKRTGQMWQQPILHYVQMEMAVDALKRTKNVDDKEDLIDKISTINLKDSIAGPLDFTAPVDMAGFHPVKNVVVTPLYGGQWVKGTGKFMFDIVIVSDAAAKMVKVQRKLTPLNP